LKYWTAIHIFQYDITPLLGSHTVRAFCNGHHIRLSVCPASDLEN